MDNADYSDQLIASFPCPKRPEIYDLLIADGATGVICAKAEAIHCACITDWDAYEAVERGAQSFLVD